MLKYIKELLAIDWISTIRFNFHYFPFISAIKFPVFLYSAQLVALKGSLTLGSEIRTGILKLGKPIVPVFPASIKFVWEDRGGDIRLCSGELGAGSAISVQKGASLTIGKSFHATSYTKIISALSIEIGDYCTIGWNTIIMDTDWHSIYDIRTQQYSIKSKPIRIGNYNWIASGCHLMKGCATPDFCIVGGFTLLNKDLGAPSCSLIAGGGGSAKVVKEQVIFDGYVASYLHHNAKTNC